MDKKKKDDKPVKKPAIHVTMNADEKLHIKHADGCWLWWTSKIVKEDKKGE